MARRTKRQNEEIVERFYGIDPKTFEVARISLTRSGTLTRRWDDGRVYPHHIMRGRDARSEVIVVFGLTNIFSVLVQYDSAESTQDRIKELEEKAAEMKQQAQQAASKKEG